MTAATPAVDSPAPPPELQASDWLNTETPITLQGQRGRVVLVYTFQMLCPACVSHSMPQAQRLHQMLDPDQVCLIGLHTVFEHHAVMTVDALRVFAHEYRLRFALGQDEADPASPLPRTMQAYGLRGTPSLLIFDRRGRLRLNHFGHVDDLQLGLVLGQVMGEGGA